MSHANTLGSVPVPAPSASRLNEKATAQEPDSQWVACCKCGETVPFSLERTVGCLQTPSRYFDTSLALVITITCMCAWVCALNNEHTHTHTQTHRGVPQPRRARHGSLWPGLPYDRWTALGSLPDVPDAFAGARRLAQCLGGPRGWDRDGHVVGCNVKLRCH